MVCVLSGPFTGDLSVFATWADAREPLVSGGEKIWERLLGGMAQPHYVPVKRARAGVHPLGGGGLGGAAANGGGLAALLDYAREGDAIVVVGIDRLGRNAAEVMMTIRDLGERGIVLRSLREGIDTSNATGRWWPESCLWPNLSWN